MTKNLVAAKIVFNRLPELQGELRRQASEKVRRAAFAIEEQAKIAAPVDTGFLRNSVYTSTDQESGYQQALASAESANPRARMLPAVERPAPLQAVVAVGAEYGVYVEYGTHKMAAQPYLGPAAETVRPGFEAAMKSLLT